MRKILILLTSVVMLGVLFSSCSTKVNTDTKNQYNLYFANAQKNDLKAEKRTIDSSDEDEFYENVIKELLKGPSDSSLSTIIPDGTTLKSISVVNKLANVNFSKHYYNNSDALELLARYSVVNTLCSLDGIEKVKIFVDGKELVNSSGVAVGILCKEDILHTPSNMTENSVMLNLYFTNSDIGYLENEQRVVSLIDNSLEKTIVSELIKGPENSSLSKTIADGTKLISAETTAGICFVNFSQEFITKHSGGSSAETMTVYSVVNSLTELENVEKVQFLIDGKKVEVFKHIIFNEPFSRDDTLIIN